MTPRLPSPPRQYVKYQMIPVILGKLSRCTFANSPKRRLAFLEFPQTHTHTTAAILFLFFISSLPPPLYFYFGLIPKEGDGSISFSFLFFLSFFLSFFLVFFFCWFFFVFLFYGFIAGWKIGSSFWLNDFYWSVFPGREERKKEKKNPKKMERK